VDAQVRQGRDYAVCVDGNSFVGRDGLPVGTPVVPGAEDGYFSAEDYRILKESRGDGSEETRSLVRTRDGVIVIRRQETPNGPRYQVMDHRARRHDGTVIIVPQQ
jgi:hypothetical protein